MGDLPKNSKFTMTPNALFDAMLSKGLTSLEKSALIYLIRRTHGWHKTEARISIEDFKTRMHCSRQGAIDAVNKLKKRRAIFIKKNKKESGKDEKNTYSINENYDKWRQI